MRAIVLNSSFELTIENVDDPSPGVGEVLIVPSVVGICGSDIHGVRSRSPRRTPPLIMGHEFVGRVVAVGPGTDDALVGKRVAVNPQLPCRDCGDCREGKEHLCRTRGLIGGTHAGGLAEFAVAPVANCHVIPDHVTDQRAALIEPFATCVHAMNLASPFFPGDVLVIGGGAVGRLMAELISSIIASHVFVSEPDQSRRDLVRGATACLPSEVPNLVADQTVEGRGFDLVFDAVGSEGTRRQSIEALRSGGTAVWIGMEAHDSTIDGFALATREQRVLGSFAYTDWEFATAIRILAHSDIGANDVSEEVGLEEAVIALERLLAGGAGARKLSVDPRK